MESIGARHKQESGTLSAIGRLAPLLGSDGHSLTLAQARMRLILDRVRLTAAIIALLMMAWIPIDVAFMSWNDIRGIALARVLSAAALAWLIFYKPRAPSPLAAGALLAFLLAIPMLFFFYANSQLQNASWPEQTVFVRSAYAHLPILIAMLLSLFPLTAVEGAVLGAGITAATAFAALEAGMPARLLVEQGTIWTQLVITGIAVISGMSQLHFMAGFVEYSTRDEMTGCLKRDYGVPLLETLFAVSQRKKLPFCLLFVDLDHFKRVNDVFGHDTGDKVLQEAGRRLRAVLRHQDAVVRWGGEEFVVILPGATMNDVAPIFHRLKEQGLGPLPDGRAQTASIGVAEYLDDGVTAAQDLIRLADQRMYAAKQGGRNAVMMKSGSFVLVPAQQAA